ncbi:DeoR/GlpR family DNA-binding transcription regulator [Microvirga thermotolerans]|uniref:DeoR family transcriptional regulator n=1 Tax=Microvirga thermotolerans TaxID=2651334 RepID=A0A5P9K0A0_9HYPH|nr:DeoR/GlpR family DNA-binding transcription regulator [Microvirga thermotolerans]QFU17336.1 DeoR family transcriptional regulator [Microvirga thermotolerans]
MTLSAGKKAARQSLIVAELALSPTVRTSALAQRLGVSAETVRRDIEELTRRGLVSRTYGGAAGRQLGLQPDFSGRDTEAVAERDAVARLASGFVKPGHVVMIDSGSTAARFAQALAARDERITVVTNGFAVAEAFMRSGNARVMFCPGEAVARERGVYGSETCGFLRRFFADLVFIGASGLTAEGPTDVEAEACAVKRAMLERSDRRMLLIDSTKFGRRHFEIVCPLKSLSAIVADRPPDAALAEKLATNGVAVHAANREEGTA